MISGEGGGAARWDGSGSAGLYPGRVTATTPSTARWARGLAVALVTVPGVLLAQLVVTGTAPGAASTAVVCAVVAAVACAVPTRTVPGTAALAAAAQLAGHVVLALAAPQPQAREGCLSVVGRGAGLGVRYAVVRDAGCPPGSLDTSPALTAVLAAVAAAAVVLVAHALLATLTGVLVAGFATGVDLVRRLAAAVLPVLAVLLGVSRPPRTTTLPPLPEPLSLTDRWQPGHAPVRGPPAAHAAA